MAVQDSGSAWFGGITLLPYTRKRRFSAAVLSNVVKSWVLEQTALNEAISADGPADAAG